MVTHDAGSDAGIDVPDAALPCDGVVCGEHASCDARSGLCACDTGYTLDPSGDACVPIVCDDDADCDDADPCDGVERCDMRTNECAPGTPYECALGAHCVAEDGAATCACDDGLYPADGACLPACDVPLAPVLTIIDDDEVLSFEIDGDLPIEIAALMPDAPRDAAIFLEGDELPLAGLSGPTRVLARVKDASCAPAFVFDAVYDVRDTYAPNHLAEGTTAFGKADERFVGWADGLDEIVFGPGSTKPETMVPGKAFGPAEGDSTDVVCLGEAGHITLFFEPPITNGEGWDFAVFENGFNGSFLELGFVEGSSDGSSFARFDSASRFEGPPCGGCSGTAPVLGGLASKYMQGYGTPFDLEALANQPVVRSGAVDLGSITYVRIVDVAGDGATLDSFGRPIYDPLGGAPSAGFDLDAVGVLHQLDESP
jgi:hypothetical protein